MLLKTVKNYAGIGCMLIITSCGNKQEQPKQGPPPAVRVTVTDVVASNAVYYDEYPGTLTPLNQVNITAQVSGYLTGIYFKDGERVHKGQKLYSIDAQTYDANYQNAIANQEVQEANLVKAQKDADRYHELDKHDAIAKQQVDNADAALEVGKKQVAAAKATVNSMQANVRYTTIYAPFDGVIGISQVKIGTAVVAGQTQLNIVSTDNPIAVDFAVDQSEVYHFSQLQQKGASAKDSTFSIAFGTEVYPYHGYVSLLDRSVDPQTGTIKTRLVFPNDKGLLKAGMNATVKVLNNGSQNALLIPYKAVTEQLGEFFVYVVGDSSKVSQHKVALGQQIGTNVIVKSGVKDGDKVVVQGVQNLKEGSVITTAPPAAPAAGEGKKQ